MDFAKARDYVTGHSQQIASHPLFQETVLQGTNHFLHNVIIFKACLTALILISAIAVSASYCSAHNPTKKKRVTYFSDLWVGEQIGVIGTLVIIWLPTVLFLVLLKMLK